MDVLIKKLFRKKGAKSISKVGAKMSVKTTNKSGFKLGGVFSYECYDKDGNLKWTKRAHNIWVNEGLNYALNVIFKGGTRADPLYIGLKRSSGAPQAAWSMGNMTTAAGGTWTVFTGYKGNRKEFTDGAISSRRINNSGSEAVFSISAAGNIYGAFICYTGTKGAKANCELLCIDDFASSRTVASGDTVNVTYTVGTDDDGA